MIAFEELASALDRWRIRNGLPVSTGDLPPAAAPALSAPRSTPPMAAYAPAPLVAAPAVAATPIGESSDVLAIGDADVLEDEELYSNDGDDFAMSFSSDVSAGNPVGSISGSIGASPVPLGAPPAGGHDDPYAVPVGHEPVAYAAEDQYDPDAYPPTPPPDSPGADAYAQPGSGPYAQPAALPELYDDPAYDPPHDDTVDRPLTDGGYPPAEPDTLDAGDDVIDEATVVGDDHRQR